MTTPTLDAPRPAVVPAEPYVFPPAERRTLANGLEVVVYDVPGQYVHSVRLSVPLTLSAEPRDREGVATIMARTLDEGTAAHTSAEFALLLERRGVALGAGATDAGLSVDVDVAKRHLAYALDLLRQAVTEPAFPASEVGRHVKQRLAEIEQERSVAAQRGAIELIARYFDPAERASRPTAGAKETIASITRDDVVAFHSQHVAPVGATVVVAGDLDGVDAFAEIESALGGWAAPSGWEPPAARVAARLAQDRVQVFLVDRPGSVQTEFAVACPGPDRRVQDGWAPFPVLGFVLGGSPNARIDAVLREEKGFTYGIRSVFRPRRRGGMFLTSGSVRGDATVEGLDLLLGILDGARDGFRTEEAKQGVDYIAMTAASRYATADSIADEAASMALEGLTTEFTTATLRDLATVDPQRLDAAYREFVDGRWTVVVVGDAATHADGIRALGRGDVTVVTG
ncbi:pitrilysin family protein [Lapillicoccus sp.]|uniref:M16 family metallopeptidase n=1 Tax=Lapillicoccus sp. TaxID=1909287 RepID=UPI0032654E0C